MTKKKKRIYLSVLGAGLCVVAYDLISSDDGPAKAKASNSNRAITDATAVGESSIGEGLATLTIQHFPRDIQLSGEAQGLDSELVVRDLFAPSPEVYQRLLSPPEKVVGDREAGNSTPEPPPIPFGEQHQLSAIMRLKGVPSAIVDGKILRVGKRLDDCTVIEIAERHVYFECPAGIEDLRLDSPLLDERVEN